MTPIHDDECTGCAEYQELFKAIADYKVRK